MNDRKKDHIELAFESMLLAVENDTRFNYEPLLAPHPVTGPQTFGFLGKTMDYPVWISSMTGGTAEAGKINHNLARLCNEFGLGMGLGSCRKLLNDNSYFDDFNLRPVIGPDRPFWANLGIAQIEQSLREKSLAKISDLVEKLQCDGLIIHVNPFQEFFQPEGDPITRPPIDTLQEFVGQFPFPVIVKEVGQGFGPGSLQALIELRIAGIELAAFGGTNFSKLELMRSSNEGEKKLFEPFARIGHTAVDMVDTLNRLDKKTSSPLPEIIISGGIKNYLDGYYLIKKLHTRSVYGQASAFLKQARQSYSGLREWTQLQLTGLRLAQNYLNIKNDDWNEE